MAITADRVVVELEAKLGKYEANVARAEQKFDRAMGNIQKSAVRTEAITRRAAGLIGTALAGISLAGVGRLLDNFTRLQNQLKVSGLEGENLKRVQDRLFESGQRYGVSVNSLAELYAKASQAGKDLGASQTELLALTDATSQALLVTGTSSQAASGAILGLTQALSSGIVRAEEFNQINEGGLRPLLQAAAATERFGGSVGKLRQAIVDGKVTSQEFYQSILKNANLLEGQASKATLTLEGGLTALTNALIKYFGEADKANGVSAALGTALKALADNLDILIPAITAVIGAIGVRYVVAATAATAATLRLGAAATGTAAQMTLLGAAGFALQARMAGAATSMEALGFALGGISKAAAATAVILALGAALYYVTNQMTGAKDATGAYATAQEEAEKISNRAADAADKLATAHGRVREEALKAARAEAENIKQKLASARASITLAKAELARANVRLNDRIAASEQQMLLSGDPNAFGAGLIEPAAGANQAKANLEQARKTAEGLQKSLERIEAAIAGGPPAISSVEGDGKKKKGKGAAGRDPNEIRQQFNSELLSFWSRIASADADSAKSAEEAAEFERKQVEFARRQTLLDLQNNKDYSAAQKKVLLAALDDAADAELDRIEREKTRRVEREGQDLAEQLFRNEQDQLQTQFDLADSQAERQRIALDMVELENRYQRSLLEAVIASELATDAEKKRAQLALDGLRAVETGRFAGAARANETPAQKFLRDLNKTPEQINEAIDQIQIDGLERLNDELAEAILGAKSLGDAFSRVADQIIGDLLRIAIQQSITVPLANALFGGGGGSGGILGLLGIPRLAGGGSFAIGGRGGIDRNTLSLNGRPIANVSRGERVHVSNEALRGGGGGATVVQHINVDMRNSVTPDGFARELLAISNQQALRAAGGMGQAVLKGMPTRLTQFQRDGT